MRIVQVSVGSVRMPPEQASAPLQVLFNTARQFARMGHDAVIVDRKYTAGDPDSERVEGVEIARLRARQLPHIGSNRFLQRSVAELNAALFALAVSRYLRKNRARIDVVHLHLTSLGLILCILNRGLRSRMSVNPTNV